MNNCNKVFHLPPGFRFEPTDEEVVFEYLKCKVFNLPPPPYSLISEMETDLLYHSHPSTFLLPSPSQEANDEGYFFCKRSDHYGSSSSWNWKVAGDDEQILPTGRDDGSRYNMVGMKRSLVLHAGNNAVIPQWGMHEYRLLPADYSTYRHQFNTRLLHHQKEWVLCHVFQKKQRPSMLQYRRQNYNEEDEEEDSVSCSSRCSSAVTDEEEEEEVMGRW